MFDFGFPGDLSRRDQLKARQSGSAVLCCEPRIPSLGHEPLASVGGAEIKMLPASATANDAQTMRHGRFMARLPPTS